MNTIAYIVPYFGKLPSFFKIWLLSASYNKDVDFLIFTDDCTQYDIPKNVQIYYMSFEQLRELVQTNYDFEIALNKPYKLCDFKPAYGEIFSKYLRKYKFWGHCDIDLMWGKINDFITPDIMNRYDKIGYLGHSTLYRNTYEVNRRYRLPLGGEELYKTIFTNENNKFFDEDGINKIYRKYGFEIYTEEIMADLSAIRWNFFLGHHGEQERGRKQILFWKAGELFTRYIENNQIKNTEYMYAHFMQRNMTYSPDCLNNTELCIIPNTIKPMSWNAITLDFIRKNSRNRIVLYYKDLLKRKKEVITPRRVLKSIMGRIRGFIKETFFNTNNV